MTTLSAVLRYDSHGLPVYRYGAVPEGLDTEAQLRARRLSPSGLSPAAWLSYNPHHRVCALYDRSQARPIRPLSERQHQVLAAGRQLAHTVPCRRCEAVRVSTWDEPYCGPCWGIVQAERHARWEQEMQAEAQAHEEMLRADRAAATTWAAEALADPSMVVLDTETTGLLDGPDPAYLVEVTVMSGDGTVVLDTLVHPQMPIPPAATAIHGIADQDVANAPTFSEVLPQLADAVANRRVLIYNEAFDCGIVRRELDRHYQHHAPQAASGLVTHPHTDAWMRALRTECAMEQYAQWVGEWSDRRQSYRWQPLDGGHRARGDCAATLDRLQVMAESRVLDPSPS